MGWEKSGRRSTIEMQPERKSIEKWIVLETMPITQIAKRLGIHQDSVRRFRDNKLTEERRQQVLIEARREEKEAEDAALNGDQIEITTSMKRVLREIEGILSKVKADDDHSLALTALRDMRGTLMDLGKLYGQLNDKTTIVVPIMEVPEWGVASHDPRRRGPRPSSRRARLPRQGQAVPAVYRP